MANFLAREESPQNAAKNGKSLNNLAPLTCSWSSYKYNTQSAQQMQEEVRTLSSFKLFSNIKNYTLLDLMYVTLITGTQVIQLHKNII